MQLILGLILIVGAVTALYFSLPRNGKTVGFAGTDAEGYITVAMLGAFVIGIVLMIEHLAS